MFGLDNVRAAQQQVGRQASGQGGRRRQLGNRGSGQQCRVDTGADHQHQRVAVLRQQGFVAGDFATG